MSCRRVRSRCKLLTARRRRDVRRDRISRHDEAVMVPVAVGLGRGGEQPPVLGMDLDDRFAEIIDFARSGPGDRGRDGQSRSLPTRAGAFFGSRASLLSPSYATLKLPSL